MEKAITISRCSTTETRQDVTRQTSDLMTKYKSSYEIIKNFEYYKSGLSNDEQLSEIISYAISNNIDHILFTEVSRIARRVIEILLFIQDCTKCKINVVIDNYNMHSLNADKTENVITKTMLQIGAAFAEMELKQTQQRLNSGRANYIAKGGRLGRNKDTKETKEQILDKHRDVVKFLKQGQSIRNIMKLTEKSSATVQKVKQLIAT
ncbi:recombinase family protein [Pedobacter sp. FW305-3-2-15-E-R2A2]|uniref:recombinase family protein n=1 Tax=Pedobacter sp. FW305-3-2-15-E-R2A2 TaxID=3140251 RepID=UPI0031401AB3